MINRNLYLYLFLSLILNFVFLIIMGVSFNSKNTTDVVVLKDFMSLSENEKIKIDLVKNKMIVNDTNYLFLGDSITYRYDLKKFYGYLPVVNSGIDGNKTCDIMEDLKNRVYDYNPSKIFILIGTNQLKDQTDDEIYSDIVNLTKVIHNNRKYAHIYVESIYPVNENIKNNHTKYRNNGRIRNINKMLNEKFSDSYVDYIDVYSKLADENGNLKDDYTDDGLHLTDDGYQVVTDILKNYL